MKLPGAYRTARQVGAVLGITKERVRVIEDGAIATAAERMGCTAREMVAHLYREQFEAHGDHTLPPEFTPLPDAEWIDGHRWKHEG